MTLSVGFRLAVILLSIVGATAARAEESGAPRAPLRLAQSGLPPADIPEEGGGDAAGLLVKIERLESQLRAANGQIEELQNQQRKLEEQLRKFQEDVEFRLGQNAAGAQPPGAAPAQPARPRKPPGGDAFDPNADPNAPGAPLRIGQAQPSPPLATPPEVPAGAQPLPRGPFPEPPVAGGPPVVPGVGPPDDPREVFKAAMESYGHDQYDQAEQQLRAFVAKFPKDRSAPEAIYYLGETFLKRGRMREAAEQYLNLSSNYSKSALAPSAMLRLGEALAALDNTAQACATFGEIDRRYPTATAALKRIVEAEMRKDHC
ncbi:MAG: tol-pal system protein YbgF [Roseiarcus sp.]